MSSETLNDFSARARPADLLCARHVNLGFNKIASFFVHHPAIVYHFLLLSLPNELGALFVKFISFENLNIDSASILQPYDILCVAKTCQPSLLRRVLILPVKLYSFRVEIIYYNGKQRNF